MFVCLFKSARGREGVGGKKSTVRESAWRDLQLSIAVFYLFLATEEPSAGLVVREKLRDFSSFPTRKLAILCLVLCRSTFD